MTDCKPKKIRVTLTKVIEYTAREECYQGFTYDEVVETDRPFMEEEVEDFMNDYEGTSTVKFEDITEKDPCE